MDVPRDLPRVLLVGAHGHGRTHLRNLRRRRVRPVRLVGVCDLRPLDGELRELAGPVPASDSLPELLASTEPDVTIVCTPIHTHVELAATAMRAGSHVLLEKPPAPTLAEYERLLDEVRATGRACQIGFQDLGSHALSAAGRLLAEGAVGDLRGIGVAGVWVRDASYYARAQWAGRRRLDGAPVVDGALTNPFAHAVAAALRIDGSEGAGDLVGIETDLYHARPIEADDTSSIRLTTSRGTTITAAVTLCGASQRHPYLRIHGTRGAITLWYKRDELRLETPERVETLPYGRTDLLDNLVDHLREPRTPLLVPPERTRAFMDVVEAIRTAPEVTPIPGRFQHISGDGPGERRIVDGVGEAITTSAEALRLFCELGLPWARAEPTVMRL
ncbi:MAG: gfo/Idh/MocA family oxidoreductase [Streptosporangiales bacterium]|nr:gfo/Idh/MocA family oxidoreductase [Streptosporangiales bacterium]